MNAKPFAAAVALSFSLVIPAAAEATNRGLMALRKALHP